MTRPFAPLSLPATTRTVSPFLTFIEGRGPGVGRLAAMVQSTSGASEMIFMNRLSRSSRPTGPKMRVPRGSLSGLISTAAFSSNRMYDPSGRRFSLLVRTMTAFTTSPFFTPAPGRASFTVATMTSPMPAYRRPLPPSTRMQRISFAPVLSATLSRDSCWITSTPAISRRHRSQADLLLGLLEDLGYPPALSRGQRPGLHQQHAVTHAAGVGGVVCLVLLGTAQHLAVLGVLDVVLDLDDNGLVHLVADHEALTALAVAPGLGGTLAHLPASSSSVAAPPAATPAGASSSGSPESSIRVMIPSSRSRITV